MHPSEWDETKKQTDLLEEIRDALNSILESGNLNQTDEEERVKDDLDLDEVIDEKTSGEEETPEEEELEENPERVEHDKAKRLVTKKPSGTRVTKEDMTRLQNAPAKKIKKKKEESIYADETQDDMDKEFEE